jgi:phosphoglycolate phosphatase-like HAD superfamily hydrolase
MIQYLIWDLDGTLFDTYPALSGAFLTALNDFGYTVDPDWALRLAKIGLNHCASVLASHYQVPQEEVEEAFWRHYRATPVEAQCLLPGAKNLCDDIVAIGGMNVIVTHRERKSMIAILKAYAVDDLFTDFVAGDDGYPKKPDPEAFEAIIERNGIVKDMALSVGDREIDVEAGRASGIRTCLLDASESPSQADFRVGDLTELMDIIREENGM